MSLDLPVERRRTKTGTLRAWIEVQKLPRHFNDVFSFVLGSTLAWYHAGRFDWNIFIVGLAAVFLMAGGTYLTNESQDLEGDRRNRDRIGGENTGMGMYTTGGTRVLVNGILDKKQVYNVGIAFFLLTAPLGLLLQFWLYSGVWTIPLGIAGLFFAYSYSNPPVKASYHGLGETFMMLGYAALILTAYYLQAGFAWFPLLISLPRILTVPALKLLRNIPDARADAESGKNTLVVYIGNENARILYIGLVTVAVLAFFPAFFITRSPFAILNLFPAFFFVRSLVPMLDGKWRERSGIVAACKTGFQGLLLTPVTLALTFGLAKLWAV